MESPGTEHEHAYELLLRVEADPSGLFDEPDLASATYFMLMCPCGAAEELMVLTKKSGNLDVRPVEITDWEGIEAEDDA